MTTVGTGHVITGRAGYPSLPQYPCIGIAAGTLGTGLNTFLMMTTNLILLTKSTTQKKWI